jgi:hypothetical protein
MGRFRSSGNVGGGPPKDDVEADQGLGGESRQGPDGEGAAAAAPGGVVAERGGAQSGGSLVTR